jgi:hypothetical protein
VSVACLLLLVRRRLETAVLSPAKVEHRLWQAVFIGYRLLFDIR